MLLSFLKNHPFAVEAHFDYSLVLSFAAPRERLQALLPPPLTADTFHNDTAFLAVAMVRTRDLRPKGAPAFLGSDFFLTGYRIFVRYTTSAGKRLRGLYILRSETDSRRMNFFGNLLTHYDYHKIDIEERRDGGTLLIRSREAGLRVCVADDEADVPLPPGSPFADWKEARRYAGPLPFTFTYDEPNGEVLLIEGVRESWEPKPVRVLEQEVGFLRETGLEGLTLANAFIIRDIPYYWKKGKKDPWKPGGQDSRA